MPSTDYPRMMFHRHKQPVTVQSRDEEDALGPEWSRKIWPEPPLEPETAPTPEPDPAPGAVDYAAPKPETEPSPEVASILPRRRAARVPKPVVKPTIKPTIKPRRGR